MFTYSKMVRKDNYLKLPKGWNAGLLASGWEEGQTDVEQTIGLFSHLLATDMAGRLSQKIRQTAEKAVEMGLMDGQGNVRWDVVDETINKDK